jgi:hypothetical protein
MDSFFVDFRENWTKMKKTLDVYPPLKIKFYFKIIMTQLWTAKDWRGAARRGAAWRSSPFSFVHNFKGIKQRLQIRCFLNHFKNGSIFLLQN